mgnify:CR=1 FL=1
MPPRLTPSSYAVLALLHLKPWTGYELTRQAQRSLRYAWPKSERLLYSEPKKLVELGYATVHQEDSGNRTRNVYTITAAGRQALNEWTTATGSATFAVLPGIAEGDWLGRGVLAPDDGA